MLAEGRQQHGLIGQPVDEDQRLGVILRRGQKSPARGGQVPTRQRLIATSGQVRGHRGPGVKPALRVAVGDPVQGRQDQPGIADPRRCGAERDASLVIEIGVREEAARRAQSAAHATITSFMIGSEPLMLARNTDHGLHGRRRHQPCGQGVGKVLIDGGAGATRQ